MRDQTTNASYLMDQRSVQKAMSVRNVNRPATKVCLSQIDAYALDLYAVPPSQELSPLQRGGVVVHGNNLEFPIAAR